MVHSHLLQMGIHWWGPVPGLRNFWVACGVMAGFSQGGGVGLSLAQWMIDGEPEADVFAMDVARYGEFASEKQYLSETTRQFYARRFVLTYPNEELPAGRPLRKSQIHEEMQRGGAKFGCIWGLEVPLYFVPAQPEFQETPTLRRSNAFDIVGQEVNDVRNSVGLVDITGFSRYQITGPRSSEWLDKILACSVPPIGGIRLAPMLTPAGRLAGDLTVLRLDEERFWLMGSYYLQSWHMRWFNNHLPRSGVGIENLCDRWGGISISGPDSRRLISTLVGEEFDNSRFPFLKVEQFNLKFGPTIIGRLSVCGELGYEINTPQHCLSDLYQQLQCKGIDLNFKLRLFGFRAMNSMRLEKGFGSWSREFTSAYTPQMSGLVPIH